VLNQIKNELPYLFFEKLEVYQLARKFKIDIKLMSQGFPKEERFELRSNK
jgi:hypothetical protein